MCLSFCADLAPILRRSCADLAPITYTWTYLRARRCKTGLCRAMTGSDGEMEKAGRAKGGRLVTGTFLISHDPEHAAGGSHAITCVHCSDALRPDEETVTCVPCRATANDQGTSESACSHAHKACALAHNPALFQDGRDDYVCKSCKDACIRRNSGRKLRKLG